MTRIEATTADFDASAEVASATHQHHDLRVPCSGESAWQQWQRSLFAEVRSTVR